MRKLFLRASSILDNQLIKSVVLVPACIGYLLSRLIHNCILQRWLKPIPSDWLILIAFSGDAIIREAIVFISVMMPIPTVRVRVVLILEIITLSRVPESVVSIIFGNPWLLLSWF